MLNEINPIDVKINSYCIDHYQRYVQSPFSSVGLSDFLEVL